MQWRCPSDGASTCYICMAIGQWSQVTQGMLTFNPSKQQMPTPIKRLGRVKSTTERRGVAVQLFAQKPKQCSLQVKRQSSARRAKAEEKAPEFEEGATQWDVVGLGQAMVDFCGTVEDDFVERLEIVKGARKVVDHQERSQVLQELDGKSYKVSAGGSLSNTLVALARLGMGAINVAMTGTVGADWLGDFYRTKLQRANVRFLSRPTENGTTGTVIVLTTPDAQRAMLAYQGMSSLVHFDDELVSAVTASRLLIVEGYLWELPETVEAVKKACRVARRADVTVALTASDVTCVNRFRDQFLDVLQNYADILFANTDEARALCGFDKETGARLMAEHLSRKCSFVSVTDGANGSYIGVRGAVVYVLPSPCTPVDTCGAGDAYAAGILYGILSGNTDLITIGNLAAKVAATVVGQKGARLKQKDATKITVDVVHS